MTALRITFTTFGCRVNQYETAMMRRRLIEAHADPSLDVAIINACTVTQLAERKARQAARRVRRQRPDARIVVVGCLADAVARGLTRFDEADILAGNAWKPHIVDVVSAVLNGRCGLLDAPEFGRINSERSSVAPGRVRAWLKIQDGCDNACSYCRPTQVRGPVRCKELDAAYEEATELVASGCREIVLTGISLSQYNGRQGENLATLIDKLLTIRQLLRLRIASINPEGITLDLIEVVASDPRVCPHFHVPLQSGDDRVLSRMRRLYTADEYVETVGRIRRRIPEATLGTDLIVGFPSEDERAFASTCSIVESVGFSNLHVFRYSDRNGTAAASFPDKVSATVARDRAARLSDLGCAVRDSLLDKRVSTLQDVLVEQQREQRCRGYTPDYLPVTFSSTADVALGTIHRVRILTHAEGELKGVSDNRYDTG